MAPYYSSHFPKLEPLIVLERSIHPKMDDNSFQFGVPQDRLTHFLGRDTILHELDRSFTQSSSTKLVLWGISGVGYFILFFHEEHIIDDPRRKTQCATEYCYLHLQQRRGPLIWIDARNAASRRQTVEALQKLLSLSESHHIKQHMEKAPGGLLILDNVYDEKAVYEDIWWLENPPCWNVLITTQRLGMVGRNNANRGIEVPLFDAETASKLLILYLIPKDHGWTDEQKRIIQDDLHTVFESRPSLNARDILSALTSCYGITSVQEIKELAHELGNLPLALVQSSAYIQETGIEISQYLRKLKNRSLLMRLDVFKHLATDFGLDRNILTSFEVSFLYLEKNYPYAARLLRLFGFLDRNSIFLSLLKEFLNDMKIWSESESFKLEESVKATCIFLDQGHPEFDRGLGLLVSLCLIQVNRGKDSISIHSQVHECIHLRLSGGKCARMLMLVVKLLSHRLPPLLYSSKDDDAPKQQALVLVHAERVLELAELYDSYIYDVDELCVFCLESYLWYQGDRFLNWAENLEHKLKPKSKGWVSKLVSAARIQH